MRKFEEIEIAVVGTGYVGLSIATLLAQHHKVTSVDVIPETKWNANCYFYGQRERCLIA